MNLNMNIIKNTSKFLGMLAITTLIVPAASAQVFVENFSSAPTIDDVGGDTSPFISNDIARVAADQSKFIDSTHSELTHNPGTEDLSFTSGAGTAWLYIDTSNSSTWSTGDYTVSFDGQVTSGDTMYWDVFGGNSGSGGTAQRLWNNKSRPEYRAVNSGTAERLGQINPAGDVAGTAFDTVAAGSFTDTTLTSQSLTITLTSTHVGSANDYIMIGWNNTGGNGDATIDNVSIAAVPEPSSFALLGVASLILCALRRRRS